MATNITTPVAILRSQLEELRELPYFVSARTVAAAHLAPMCAPFDGRAQTREGMVDLVGAEVLGGFMTPRGQVHQILVALPEE